jgi:hypothetical protein
MSTPVDETASATTFDDAFHLECFADASYYARALFRECFGSDFPVPRDQSGLPVSTPREAWRQYVAFYRWPDARFEAVGFCNWIRCGRYYLGGGMCVSPTFYRRMPREHFAVCRARGGVAQLMVEAAFRELTDCDAWFGYCGDRKAYQADIRAGFTATRHPLLVAKWRPGLSEAVRTAIEDEVAAIGPF